MNNQQKTEESKPEEPRKVPSEEILKGDRLVTIIHENQSYRLVATRNGKLILQK